MAEKFRFFDAVEDENGVHDREYNAQEFTDYFKALVTTGVMKGAGNELKVTANGSNMITKVDTGIAFLLGRYYENDNFKDLTHDTETLGNSRIDRVVVRMDLSTEARYVKTFIKKGVPSTNPVAPTLTQTQNLYEISLAQVKIVGGQTFIASNNVTDERGKDIICPWAGSNILPNFNADSLDQLVNDFNSHITNKASTSAEGHVQLNNTLTSTSTTQAATANAIKIVNDKFTLAAAINATLASGWANHAYGGPLTYFKDSFGVVHLNGRVSRSGGTSTLTTLPASYRPTRKTQSTCLMGATGIGEVEIDTNGAVVAPMVATGGNILIDIAFRTT